MPKPTPDGLIYKLWRDNTLDPRYFKRWKWEKLKLFIQDKGIKSVLEFGSGVSTLMFESYRLKTVSYETDDVYMEFVRKLSKGNISFVYWNNSHSVEKGSYDLGLVDGIMPRNPQLQLAIKHCKYIAVDDYRGEEEDELKPLTKNLKRIDDPITDLAIFEV